MGGLGDGGEEKGPLPPSDEEEKEEEEEEEEEEGELRIEEGGDGGEEEEEDDGGSKGDEESEMEGGGEEENLEEEEEEEEGGRDNNAHSPTTADPQTAMRARTKGGERLGAMRSDATPRRQHCQRPRGHRKQFKGLLFYTTRCEAVVVVVRGGHSWPKPSVSSMANMSFSFSCS
ncbi:hypothetical protein N1851_017406 [Merluccius polli]|uniref:Uncharacterized protein n=1 Tax=Merluccius polli TaxID=89951 RepID=A0AA47P0T0_MERPO|nr:hypothetical protein N1851_017406 [Merluccius polli]